MHFHLPHPPAHWPRFDIHPVLGLADLAVVVGSPLALAIGSALAMVSVDWTGLAGLVVAVGGAGAAIGGVVVNMQKNAIERIKLQQADNTAKIKAMEEDRVREARENAAKIAAVQAATDRQDRENREKILALEAAHNESLRLDREKAVKIAALEAQNAGQAKELAQIGSAQHKLSGVVSRQGLEIAAKTLTTPDPDRSGPIEVVVRNDKAHAIPTRPVEGGGGPGA